MNVKCGKASAYFITRTAEQLRAVEAVHLTEKTILESLLGSLSAGDTFYDIGSNAGLYALLASGVVGEQGCVVAFEPEPRTFALLDENIKTNGVSNVLAFRMALGEQDVKARLFNNGKVGNFSLLPTANRTVATSYSEVEVVQGDDFVKARGLPPPSAVKIDVEGYEYAVLRGLRSTLSLPSCKFLCCEIHPGYLPVGVVSEDVIRFLTSLGFSQVLASPSESPFHAIALKPTVAAEKTVSHQPRTCIKNPG